MSKTTKKFYSSLALAAVVAMPMAAMAEPVSAQTALTKGQFLSMFLESVNIKPDLSGKSTFQDVSSKTVLWGYVHKSLELGLAPPDNKTRFGVSDAVSAAFATSVVAKYYHMDLAGQPPLTWAVKQGLMASNTGNLTLAEGKQFIAKLKAFASSIASIPGSWTLSSTKRKEFSSALANYDNALYSQTTCVETDRLQFQIAPKWRSDASLVSALQSEANQYERYTSTYDVGTANGQSAAIAQSTLVEGEQGSNSAKTDGTWTYVNYHDDVYFNDGSGTWSKQSNFGWMAPENVQIPVFTTGALQDVKYQKGVGEDVFTGQLKSQVAEDYYAPFIQGFLSTALNTSTVSQSLVHQIGEQVVASVTLHISLQNGNPVLTAEDVHTLMRLPKSVIGRLGGTGASAKRVSEVIQSMDVVMSAHATIAYQNIPLVLPSGLSIPGWSNSAGNGTGNSTSSSGNSTTNSTGNGVSGTGTGNITATNATGTSTANGTSPSDGQPENVSGISNSAP
ncbi:hypothetical protein Heshes_10090 [Alicyclobacillus hesperidum]|uniref:S-layer homology domain-containing protein n=1 Tax=Alicyclobacillus hesperidum TaxID=89784 RepID=A0AA37X2W6_9BACL|nr:hypothetical protein [Alicyclobacillus hesperidum]GLV13325.1 hypothetical protein Heshes_10090 [Alicyclobacillus hesperidum]